LEHVTQPKKHVADCYMSVIATNKIVLIHPSAFVGLIKNFYTSD